MSADACTNEEWAAENGESVEWARAMWSCDCSKCTPREPIGYMVVAVRPSRYEDGASEYSSAGSVTSRDAAENHRAFCEMSAEAEPERYGDVEYRVMALVEASR